MSRTGARSILKPKASTFAASNLPISRENASSPASPTDIADGSSFNGCGNLLMRPPSSSTDKKRGILPKLADFSSFMKSVSCSRPVMLSLKRMIPPGFLEVIRFLRSSPTDVPSTPIMNICPIFSSRLILSMISGMLPGPYGSWLPSGPGFSSRPQFLPSSMPAFPFSPPVPSPSGCRLSSGQRPSASCPAGSPASFPLGPEHPVNGIIASEMRTSSARTISKSDFDFSFCFFSISFVSILLLPPLLLRLLLP